MKNIRKQIKALVDFTEVSSSAEAEAKYNEFRTKIDHAINRMQNSSAWEFEEVCLIREYANQILMDRYTEALIRLNKHTRENWIMF